MSNLPPVQPPDFRNGRQQYQGNQNYPPQNSNNYPPPGSSNYPPPEQPRPQQPRQPQQPQQPQQPSYPPPNQGNYPPPGYNPPPQQPTQPRPQPRQPQQPQQPSYPPPGQQPPAYSPQDPGWDDPVPPQRRSNQRGASAPTTSSSSSGLEDVNVPDLRRSRSYDNYDEPGVPARRGRRTGAGIFSEGQFEALIWGVVVILLGVAVILALTSDPDWLTSYWPLMSGILLFGSILFQKTIMGWRVSPLTQLLATLLISYSITQLVAGTNDDNGFFTLVAYYLGTCIITAGILILFGIFRQSSAG